jgi:hypothetical protein
MDQPDALGHVGVPNPGGQPSDQRQFAQGWEELAARLQEHQERLESLVSQAPNWQDASSADFLNQLNTFAQSSQQAAETSARAAEAQRTHADSHERALEIIKELAIQIAVTLAFIAAAALFPLALAAAQAQLVMLAQTAGRVVSMLARFLSALGRSLAQVRTAIEGLSQLSFRTESFAVGYGRFLADGVRDFTIDLLANSTTSAILHKPITAQSLLTSAGVSFGVGGFLGALENSSAKKLLGEAGTIQRNADGLPKFELLGTRYRNAVENMGGSSATKSADSAKIAGKVPTGAGTKALDDAARANAHARDLGVHIGAREGERLTAGLSDTSARLGKALETQGTGLQSEERAAKLVRQSGDALSSAKDDVTHAQGRLSEAQTLRDVMGASGKTDWARHAEEQLTGAKTEHASAQQHLTDARDLHEQHQQAYDQARHVSADNADQVVRTTSEHQQAAGKLSAWQDMSAKASAARSQNSLGSQLSYAVRHNDWRDSFGAARGWRNAVFYDGVKDGTKGFLSNLTQSGISAGQGNTDPGSVWKEALLGAAGGSARGVLKGKMTNVAFPNGGLEEIMWKSGTKGLDKFAREQITQSIEPPKENKESQGSPGGQESQESQGGQESQGDAGPQEAGASPPTTSVSPPG